jgi:hypothetical protein
VTTEFKEVFISLRCKRKLKGMRQSMTTRCSVSGPGCFSGAWWEGCQALQYATMAAAAAAAAAPTASSATGTALTAAHLAAAPLATWRATFGVRGHLRSRVHLQLGLRFP